LIELIIKRRPYLEKLKKSGLRIPLILRIRTVFQLFISTNHVNPQPDQYRKTREGKTKKDQKGSKILSMKRGVDYIGVGVGALIIDQQGRLFLTKRGELARNERGFWEFPGGAVEFGETLADALRREMREEFGIEIEVGKLLDVVDHILPAEGQHWVSPTYLCRIIGGEPHILEPDKCSATGWFMPENAPGELTMITRQNLEHYRELFRKP
jgi:8-oxo-dGTP diphosphatase